MINNLYMMCVYIYIYTVDIYTYMIYIYIYIYKIRSCPGQRNPKPLGETEDTRCPRALDTGVCEK